MLVQCPSCHTTYKVAEGLIAAPSPTFRCSRCRHIFVLKIKPDKNPVQQTSTTPGKGGWDKDDLTFSFRTVEDTEAGVKKEQEDSTRRKDQPPLRTNDAFTISQEAPSPWAEAITKTSEMSEDLWQLPSSRPDEKEQNLSLKSGQKEPLSTLPWLSLCGILLLVYTLLMLMHRAQPRTLDVFLKTVPGVASSLFQNNHLTAGIALKSLHPSFQKVPGNREVFVVSGVAVNRNDKSVRNIRVEGRLYNGDGKAIESQAVWVGNALSRKIIRSLTVQDISILQSLSPQKQFKIPSKESANFVVVFLKQSGKIKKFSCRVLSADQAV
ncbi:MAG: DUF3426 domain-containing protein [Candidatus Binatia bacterium]